MVALITPTGARPDQFALCARWMGQQDYKGTVLWVIVDDGEPKSTDTVTKEFREGWEILKIYPTPVWEEGQNTQGRNMRAGLRAVKNTLTKDTCEAVFIIEDDDYYTPGYLTGMMDKKNGAKIWGEGRTIYYNVRYRRWITNGNKTWSSLFQTAFDYGYIDNVIKLCYEKFIDLAIFGALGYAKNKNRIPDPLIFDYEQPLSVGIKGMPGRMGIGAGHRLMKIGMEDDISMIKLKSLTGIDYEAYRHYFNFGHV